MNAVDVDNLRLRSEALPDALAAFRRDAVLSLEATGLPTTRHEDWKYTDLASVAALSDAWLAEPDESSPSSAADEFIRTLVQDTDITWLVVRNGDIAGALSTENDDAIRIRRLSDEVPAHEFKTPLSALNVALLKDGLVIDVDRTPERTIGLLFVDDAETSGGIAQARADIRVAANATVELIEYHASFGSHEHYANVLLTLDVADGGEARHVRIQNRGVEHSMTQNLEVELGRDARFKSAAFDFGGRLTRNDLLVNLPQKGAEASFNGLYLAGDGQHVDNHTRVDHRVGPAASRQQYRGILFGRSRAVWNGKALVYKGADGTDAEQSNHNLLLSENAEIDTKPELEIYAEDVRCSHGTTVGQLDERALFYLRSRGLDAETARRLLVRAFAAETLSSVPSAAIGEHLGQLLDAALNRIKDLPGTQ